MKKTLLELAYRAEVFFSRCQGISFNPPRWNGEYLLIRQLKGRVRVAVDAGANLGDWSAYLLGQTLGRAQLTLVEPLPANVAHLAKRFSEQRNVIIRQCALAKASGVIRFSGSAGVGSGAGHVVDKEESGSIEVEALTLCDLQATYGDKDLDLVKLDIEGEEMAALRGAEPLFRREKIGALQLEYNCTWLRTDSRMKHLFEFASDFQYHVLLLTPFGLARLPAYGIGLEDFRLRNLILARADTFQFLRPIKQTGRARVEAGAASFVR